MATDQRIQEALNAIKQSQFDEAKDLLSDILIRQVNHAQARWLFALCLEQQDKPREAVNQLKLLLKHSRKDIKKINQLAQHFLKKSYPLDPVLNAYRKYIEHKPDDTNAVFNYAWYLTRAARYEDALAAYESIMNIDAPGLDEIHLNIANLCMDHLGNHEKAREHIEYVFTLNPRHVGAWHNLGNLFEQLGKLSKRKKIRSWRGCGQRRCTAATATFISRSDGLVINCSAMTRPGSICPKPTNSTGKIFPPSTRKRPKR